MDKTSHTRVTGNSQANDNRQPSDALSPAEKKIAVGVQADSSTGLLAASHSPGIQVATTAPTYTAGASSSTLTQQQQFFNAVDSGNLAEVTRLLTAHPPQIDIKLTDPATGKSPLRMALEAKNDRMAQALLIYGAPVNAFDSRGRTPVMLAAAAGLTQTVKMLTSHGATVDDVDKSGYTTLHHAVQGGNAEILTSLIHAKANVNATDRSGCTPLHHAATAGSAEMAKVLIKAGAKADPKDRARTTPLWNACKAGKVEVVHILLGKGAKAERYCGSLKDSTPMLAACSGDNDVQALSIVKLLLGEKASVNFADRHNGNVPLIAAAKNGLFSTTAYLLNECGASPDAVNNAGETALYGAQENTVKLLNDHGIKKGLREKIL